MFTLQLSPTYEWPVRFRLAAATGGQHADHEFTALFKRLDTDELEELGRNTASQNLSDSTIAAQVLAGWQGVSGPDGRELPFNSANAKRVLSVPGVAAGVLTAFFASQGKAAEKN